MTGTCNGVGSPAPLTPPDSNLRGMPWMPLNVDRLLDSDLWALASGAELRAALALWCKSWSQLPAGSLPNDERILASLSGAGSDWASVRQVALRNWVLCTDGRLYHPVVAEAACEAWQKRLEHVAKQDAAAARKQVERDDRARLFAALNAAGQRPAWNVTTARLREMASTLLPQDPEEVTHLSRVTGGDSHGPVTPHVTAKTGTGTGTVKAKKDTPSGGHSSQDAAAAPGDLWSALARNGIPAGILTRMTSSARIAGWASQGVSESQLDEAIDRARQARQRDNDPTPINLGFIDCHVQDVLRGISAAATFPNPARSPGYDHGDDLGRQFAANGR